MVAVGWTRYFAQGEQPQETFHNAYLLGFDGDGRCRSFTEYAHVLQP